MKLYVRERRRRSSLAPALAVTLAACVFPAGSSTGLEFSWRFREQASEYARPRTCAGALVSHVEVQVTDTEDETRTRTERYACDGGYVGPGEQSPPLSEAFFDVRPGTYDVVLTALDVAKDGDGGDEDAARVLGVSERRVTLDHGITLTPVELPLDPLTTLLGFITIDFEPSCDTVGARLRYEDPERDLDPEATVAVETRALPAYYGEDLEGHHGMPFNGDPIPCDLLGPQILTVDRGRYILELEFATEGQEPLRCAAPLTFDADQPSYYVDLAAACATDSLANPSPDR